MQAAARAAFAEIEEALTQKAALLEQMDAAKAIKGEGPAPLERNEDSRRHRVKAAPTLKKSQAGNQ